MDVGVRELRNGLSRHLAAVRRGQVITVTDHGRPIARIVGVDEESPIEHLVAAGKVTPARRERGQLPPREGASGSVSELISQQRR